MNHELSIMDFKNLTISKARELLDSKKLSVRELAEYYLKNIKEKNKELNVYLEVYDDVLEQAERAQGMIDNAIVGEMTGIPVGIKDNILIKGRKVSAASKMLQDHTATYTATAAQKLIDQGAVFLGRTNMDEFAMGGSTENSAFGVTKNPYDYTRVAGGSSGGSVVAVAADLAMASLGSDTGGSVREPASFCGVVGLKPTYGAVSRYGVMAMASSLDQIGPFSKTVEDAAILFNEIRGQDVLDATSADVQYGPELLAPKLEDIRKLRIGIPKEYFVEGLSAEIGSAVEKAIHDIKSLKVEIKEVSLPHTKYALSCYYIIMPAEVSSNLERFEGIRYGSRQPAEKLIDLYKKNREAGFGAESKRRILLGTCVLSSGYYDAYYAKAQKVRRLIAQDFDQVFKEVDLVLTPVTPTLPFKFGEKTDNPLEMYLSDAFTIPVNLAGLPAMSLPVNQTKKDKLPVGFQLIGRHFKEADILGLGQYYEKL